MNISIKAIPVLAISFLFASCGNNTMQKNSEGITTPVSEAALPVNKPAVPNADSSLTLQIQDILKTYLDLQVALAADKKADAASAATRLQEKAVSNKYAALSPEMQLQYETHVVAIRENAAAIGSGGDIERQRAAFAPLSEHVIAMLKVFGSGMTVYHTYCPMAFDNKGASWLSDKMAIRNPYFGDKMLECGEVQSIYKK